MKKFQQIALALLISCSIAQIHTASADGSSSRQTPGFSVFDETDAQLFALYPRTLDGWGAFDPRIVPFIDQIERDWQNARPNQVLAVREYYFAKFFEFMDGVLEHNTSRTTEFDILWKSIHTEASDALKGDLGKLEWRMIETMFMRGLLLASKGIVSDAAKDLLREIPGMKLLFAALELTPKYLLKSGENPDIPAWKHSSVACIQNIELVETGAHHPYLNPYPLHHKVGDRIKEEADRLGLRENVFIPMPGLGKIGVTTILEMWLEHVYPLPLTYGEYKAHGLTLGTAGGAGHDKAHGEVDNRRHEVHQATINLLKTAPKGNITRVNEKLATAMTVERYQAWNKTLKALVGFKKREAIDALTNSDASVSVAISASASADDGVPSPVAIEIAVGSAAAKSAAKKIARQKYNAVISPLFEILHERYAFNAEVLAKVTFAESITQLCTNATTAGGERFNELDTLFNSRSDLADAQIKDVVRGMDVSRTKIYIAPPVGDAVVPQTIGQHARFDLENATISRGDVYTTVEFNDNETGELVKIRIASARYLFETAKDQNDLLRLVGQEVEAPIIPALPVGNAGRAAVEQSVATWLTEVRTKMDALINQLPLAIQVPGMVDAIRAYDDLVARQNAAWAARFADRVAEEDEGKHDE